MLCQRCHQKEATVHIQKTVGQYKTEAFLCADCAKKENEMSGTFGNMMDFNIGKFLSGMLGMPGEVAAAPKEEVCPSCGMHLSELSKHGRLGCPACYQAFRKELRPLLKQIHGASQHVGKVPQHASQALKWKKQKEDLQQQLEAAIEAERYEDAAALRDQIRGLTAKMEGGKADE